jgi:intraflagellar transport protein 56
MIVIKWVILLYYIGHFFYSVKAFDILERFDGENEYEDALKGGVVGLFQ